MSLARSRTVRMYASCLCALLTVLLAWAQEQNKAAGQVKLNVLVLDSQSRPVAGLRQEDFTVMEGGKPQSITFFSAEELPLSYGLLIDTSGSLRSQSEKLGDAAFYFINALKPHDEAFVVGFIDSAVITQELTGDKSALAAGVNNLSINKGQTALVDAIYVSAEYLNKHKKEKTRRALLLISDGEERNSYYKPDQLVNYLRASDIQVFIIGLVQGLDKDNGFGLIKSTRQAAEDLLDRLARETGGRVFYPKDRKGVQQAAEEIMLDLRSQYVIGYLPASPPKAKQYRKVEVSVTAASDGSKRKVYTRAGYIATQQP